MTASAATWLVVTGLDGAGKTTLVQRVSAECGAFAFRLPHHAFVREAMEVAGRGTPFGDAHTDRLVFAADARLTDYRVRQWQLEHRALVSQRGWMDNFIFGAVQGWSYEETAGLLRVTDLVRPTAIICLVATADVAFERLRTHSTTDKYETGRFLVAQRRETLRFFEAITTDPALEAFRGVPTHVIDTSGLDPARVWEAVEPVARQALGR